MEPRDAGRWRVTGSLIPPLAALLEDMREARRPNATIKGLVVPLVTAFAGGTAHHRVEILASNRWCFLDAREA